MKVIHARTTRMQTNDEVAAGGPVLHSLPVSQLQPQGSKAEPPNGRQRPKPNRYDAV